MRRSAASVELDQHEQLPPRAPSPPARSSRTAAPAGPAARGPSGAGRGPASCSATPILCRAASGSPGDVHAGDARRAGGDRQQRRQHPHGRRLAGAIRPQEAKDLAALDPQVDPAHRLDVAVVLDQPLGLHRRVLRSLTHKTTRRARTHRMRVARDRVVDVGVVDHAVEGLRAGAAGGDRRVGAGVTARGPVGEDLQVRALDGERAVLAWRARRRTRPRRRGSRSSGRRSRGRPGRRSACPGGWRAKSTATLTVAIERAPALTIRPALFSCAISSMPSSSISTKKPSRSWERTSSALAAISGSGTAGS